MEEKLQEIGGPNALSNLDQDIYKLIFRMLWVRLRMWG